MIEFGHIRRAEIAQLHEVELGEDHFFVVVAVCSREDRTARVQSQRRDDFAGTAPVQAKRSVTILGATPYTGASWTRVRIPRAARNS